MSTLKRALLIGGLGFLALLLVAAFVWRDDILRTALDPKVPYQTYQPPPAPDYGRREAWAIWTDGKSASGPADVFFIHPTTYDGGRDWNAPIDQPQAARLIDRAMSPNYAGAFLKVGRVLAPRYRQASLYTRMTFREDAQEARRFAYNDVLAAFRWYLANENHGRPFILAGVEQGGDLAARLLQEAIAPDAAVRARLVAVYLIETVVPADDYGPQAPARACTGRPQAGCVVAYATAQGAERAKQLRERAFPWRRDGRFGALTAGESPLCVNPVLGAATDARASERLNLGAVNATGLEWGARPALMKRQAAAQCVDGVLRVTRPKSNAFHPSGSWADRKKAPFYNLFYADLEADAQARLAAWRAVNPRR